MENTNPYTNGPVQQIYCKNKKTKEKIKKLKKIKIFEPLQPISFSYESL